MLMKFIVRWLSKRGFFVVDKTTFHQMCNTVSWAYLVVGNPSDRSRVGSMTMLDEQVRHFRFQNNTIVLPKDAEGWYCHRY